MPMFGGDSTKSSDEEHHDHPDAVIDPALRKVRRFSAAVEARGDKNGQESSHHTDHQPSMPTRVEPSFQMSSPFVSSPALCSDARLFNVDSHDRRRQHTHQHTAFDAPAQRIPSPPPPIATIPQSHSPSPSVVSVDRSSNSTPHIRRSPPSQQQHQQQQQQQAMYTSSYHAHPHDLQSVHRQHQQHQQQQQGYAREPINHHHPHQYMYSPHPPPPPPQAFDPTPGPPRFDQVHHHDPYAPYGTAPMAHPQHPHPHAHQQQMHTAYAPRQGYPLPGQPPVTIVHTDDAATKLTDGIRRRCFNCCTTDTSTWRRSNLSPGKVLCNKCGLFERTHSRPRPDQFPHKRGPLASSALRGRTPPGLFNSVSGSSPGAHPGNANANANQTQLPPIGGVGAGGYGYHEYGQGGQGGGGQGGGGQQGQGLPTLQSWHGNGGSSSGPGAPPSGPANTSAGNGTGNANANANGNGATATATNGTSPKQKLESSPRLLSSSTSSGSTSTSATANRTGSGVKYEDNDGSRSHPPSPPSRGSTSTAAGGGGKANGVGVSAGVDEKVRDA